MARALVFLAETGFEEVEAITPVDYLRRANIEVVTAAIGNSKSVTGSHNIHIEADVLLSDIEAANFDAYILPGGGPGAEQLAENKLVDKILREEYGKGKLIAAICASPAVVLAPKGILDGKDFTCYPGLDKNVSGANWCDDNSVTDGNLITSRGAGTACDFSLDIIEYLLDAGTAKKIAQSVVLL
jgi:4-methyl-5(b-hydroxyethyl)-thiazole monophosphate biosynthesis